MSYIRPLSNPEQLYICGGMRGTVEIFAEPELPILVIPRHVFHGLLKRWNETRINTSYRGATLLQTLDWQWTMSYERWGKRKIKAYTVTWAYVAASCREHRR